MNILSLFPAVPLVMMLGLWLSKSTRQIHTVMVAGSSLLVALAVVLVVQYLGLRGAGETAQMLFTESRVWYAPLNIHYAVGVDGISVAMLLLSAVIVFTGTFASWQMKSRRQSLLPLVLPVERGGVRVLHFGRPLHDVPVLRGGADPDVPADRRLGQRAQGIRRHEADADAHGRFGVAADRHSASTSVRAPRR